MKIEYEEGPDLSRECLSAAGGPDRPFTEQQIMDKISSYTDEIYPNFRPTLAALVQQEEELLAGSWENLVNRLVEKR